MQSPDRRRTKKGGCQTTRYSNCPILPYWLLHFVANSSGSDPMCFGIINMSNYYTEIMMKLEMMTLVS
jgi:hypothetical protein